MRAFMQAAERRWGIALPSYEATHRWSVDRIEEFWQTAWDTLGIIGERGARVLTDADKMPGARFFPDARLNFAENQLRFAGPEPALLFRRADGLRRQVSRDELISLVGRLARALPSAGVALGDRVAGYLPHMTGAVDSQLPAAK